MRTGCGLLLALVLSTSGCESEMATTPDPEQPEPPHVPTPYLAKLYVTGKVTDASGRAVENALVVVLVQPTTHRVECESAVLPTGGRTDANGVYLNVWGENGWLGRGCVRAAAWKDNLRGRADRSDVTLRSVADALPPDTLVVDIVLDDR